MLRHKSLVIIRCSDLPEVWLKKVINIRVFILSFLSEVSVKSVVLLVCLKIFSKISLK